MFILVLGVVLYSANSITVHLSHMQPNAGAIWPPTIVLCSETGKFLASFILLLMTSKTWSLFELTGFHRPKKALLYSLYFAVPGLFYAVQNSAAVMAIDVLGSSLFQVLQTFNIFTVAVLSVVFLKRKYTRIQWTSLIVLIMAASVAQLDTSGKNLLSGVPFIGLLLMGAVTTLSGMSAVYTEYFFKGEGAWAKDQPLFAQNTQLYFYGMIFNGIGVLTRLQARDFFLGWNFWTLSIVFVQVAFGMSIGYILKHWGSIVKVYVACAAMLLVAVLNYPLFSTVIELKVGIAIILVTCSGYLFQGEESKLFY